MEIHTRHAGDVERPILLTFPDGTNLAGATVSLQVVADDGTALLDAAVQVTSASDPATAEYAPLEGELDVLGLHRVNAEVEYASGVVESYPTPGFAWLLVEEQVA